MFTFQTAWSPPEKWLIAAAVRYPKLQLFNAWADEDFPDSGWIIHDNGEALSHVHNEKQDAYDFISKFFPDFFTENMKEVEKHNKLDQANKLFSTQLQKNNIVDAKLYEILDGGTLCISKMVNHGRIFVNEWDKTDETTQQQIRDIAETILAQVFEDSPKIRR